MIAALAEVTGLDPATNGDRFLKIARVLRKADPPYSPAEVIEFGLRYFDFFPKRRGERERPYPGEIKNNIHLVRDRNKRTAKKKADQKAAQEQAAQDRTKRENEERETRERDKKELADYLAALTPEQATALDAETLNSITADDRFPRSTFKRPREEWTESQRWFWDARRDGIIRRRIIAKSNESETPPPEGE